MYIDMKAKMLAALPFERVTTTGADALAQWAKLKTAGRGIPVIIGDDEQLERIAEQLSINDPAVFPEMPRDGHSRTAAEILAAATKLRGVEDVAAWEGAYKANDLTAPEGPWPRFGQAQGAGLTIATDLLTGKPLDRVHILLVPAAASWEVPAHLRWGNWNACPPPEYHVAALRSWHRQYGIELIAINGDTMNLRGSRMPKDRGEALRLARQLYGYCPDIVDQGVETLSALGASLMADRWWYFWWDEASRLGCARSVTAYTRRR